MYDELVKALRNNSDHYGFEGENGLVHLLTNAADAIEELSAYAELYKDIAEKYQQLAINLIEERPCWIPVEERLPDTDGDYLVWFYDARCCKVAEYSKHTVKERHVWWFAGIDRTKFVTHWMPLPEPPKEET